MQIGKTSGRITTKDFGFEAEARVKKLDYVMLKGLEGKWILACIDSIVRQTGKTQVHAKVIGYRDKRGFLKTPRIPFEPETPVYAAQTEFIKKVLSLPDEGLYVGLLEGYNIKVDLPAEHLIKKHVAVLAKTGTGKSYVTGVLLEELAEKKIPVVIIDPHGEYFTLRKANTKKNELRFAKRFGIEPKSYRNVVSIFGTITGKLLKLNSRLSVAEIIQMLPAKISASQKGILYSAVKNLSGQEYNLRNVIDEVNANKSQAKWNLLSMLEFLNDTKIFSANPTKPEELVQEGKISIIDLKDAKPEIQQIIVLKLVDELFEARKHGKIPSFLLVLEEAHNFCPERGFGEVASSKILRTVASEGRKFGMGLVIISQRPARVDKNILSQANTQIILKVTNPNDLKAIADSVEGLSSGTKEEIKDLPIGVALVVGVTDQPLMVDIRVRRSEHGGEGIKLSDRVLLPEEKMIVFHPNVSEDYIKSEFKGIEDIQFLHYPVWRINSEHEKEKIDFYVDGITGEILFQRGSSVERSMGIKTILDLPPSSRLIVLYLTTKRFATPEKISEDLQIPLSTVQNNVKDLLGRNYLATNGYMFRNKLSLDFPENLSLFQIEAQKKEGKIEGLLLDFMVTSDFAKKAAEIWNLKIKKIEPIYYPYWLVKHRNRMVLIDGINARIDLDTSKIVTKLI